MREERGFPKEEENISDVLENVSRAGNILIDYFGRIKELGIDKGAKGVISLAIEADETVDGFLRAQLRERYPGSQFLTEDTMVKDYARLRQAGQVFIIDSLDGVINFSRGHENFAISVALVADGKTRLGVIHVPMRSETYWAWDDKDRVFLNGQSVQVSGIKQLKDALVAVDWPYNAKQRKTVVGWVQRFAPYVRQIKSTGSAASDLALIVCGRIDAYIQLGTKPWDTAAGSFLVQKAGGIVTTPEGEEWNPFNDRILATNSRLHDAILNLVK